MMRHEIRFWRSPKHFESHILRSFGPFLHRSIHEGNRLHAIHLPASQTLGKDHNAHAFLEYSSASQHSSSAEAS